MTPTPLGSLSDKAGEKEEENTSSTAANDKDPKDSRDEILTIIFIIFAVIIGLFLLREFTCWFFRTTSLGAQIQGNHKALGRIEKILSDLTGH